MLTRDLLQVQKWSGRFVAPRYWSPEQSAYLADKVIRKFKEGKTRGAIMKDMEELEDFQTYKFIKGLAAIMERRTVFEKRAPCNPAELRATLFSKGYVTHDENRQKLVAKVAEDFGMKPEDVDKYLWADIEENEILVSTENITPEELVREYNLSATQTLLFDALNLKFSVSGNYKNIFRAIKIHGLMYAVDATLTITIDGPLSLFRKTKKYGTAIAKVLPFIMSADKWTIEADIVCKGDKNTIRKFRIDSDLANLFPKQTKEPKDIFDSKVEKKFYQQFEDAIKRGWKIKRESTIIRAGPHVMIPDFEFEFNNKGFYVEIVGFWTPEYLKKKIEKAKRLESDKPIIFIVNKHLNCTREDFGEKVDEVLFYSTKIPTETITNRIKNIEKTSTIQLH